VHATPADFTLGSETFPKALSNVGSLAEGLCDPLGAVLRVLGPLLDAGRRIDAHDAVRPNTQLAQLGRNPTSLEHLLDELLSILPSPIADPPPVGGQTGATTEPTTNPFEAILSATRFKSSSLMSMLMCGSKRKMSTPSNFTPLTSAFAVRSSMVSRSMAGSESGPLPTRPGHMAL
jgi:hypothetical protein